MLHTVLVVLGLWFVGSVVLGLFVGRAIALGHRTVVVVGTAASMASLVMTGCGGVVCSTSAVQQHEWTAEDPAPANLRDRVRAAEQRPTHQAPTTVCHPRFKHERKTA